MGGLLTDIRAEAGNPTIRKNPSEDPSKNNFYNPNPQPPAEQLPPPGKISKEAAERTGKTNAYLLTSTIEFVRSGIIMAREYFSLTADEKQQLDVISMKDPGKLSPGEIALLQKSAKLEKKFDKKRENIKTPQDRFNDLKDGFAMYAEVTGKETSPGMILFSTITRFAMDSLIDDVMT